MALKHNFGNAKLIYDTLFSNRWKTASEIAADFGYNDGRHFSSILTKMESLHVICRRQYCSCKPKLYYKRSATYAYDSVMEILKNNFKEQ